MESNATDYNNSLIAIFLSIPFHSGLLVSFTGYALYTAFGQPSQQLRDPFESSCFCFYVFYIE
uniref:photosystem biogenesis factor 1 n=1 Tax=Arenaria przewalskii TaxID=1137813 RepID=UPI002E762F10|nr:photosystem biogenesis factor 1 [Arenaria przewalskii]WQA10671.1 photosystem biogenesis factor 1 [Arenaria przewalskii]